MGRFRVAARLSVAIFLILVLATNAIASAVPKRTKVYPLQEYLEESGIPGNPSDPGSGRTLTEINWYSPSSKLREEAQRFPEFPRGKMYESRTNDGPSGEGETYRMRDRYLRNLDQIGGGNLLRRSAQMTDGDRLMNESVMGPRPFLPKGSIRISSDSSANRNLNDMKELARFLLVNNLAEEDPRKDKDQL